MDAADPRVHDQLERILSEHAARFGIRFHGLRHRNVGDAHWVEVHLLFAKGTSIDDAHRIATEIEQAIETSVEPAAQVTTHLEPMEGHEEAHAHRPH
jgi:divalent metal cation (Fe/Co/Zn/Cd) transporter